MRGDQPSPRNHPSVTSFDQNTPVITQEVPSYLRSRVRKVGSKGKYWNKKLSKSSYHHLKGLRSSVPGTRAETSIYISYSLTPVQKKKKSGKALIQKLLRISGWQESESEGVSCSVTSDALQPHGLSMQFSRQEYWSGSPFSSPGGNLLDPGIEHGSLALQADSLPPELPDGRNRALN